ncbi:MAG TPA: hypothetical protein VMZ26_00225 [Pyrinomonadaceae bacterium]|nr:hypothetical protein [Pyrinomonadaceae bacterium]
MKKLISVIVCIAAAALYSAAQTAPKTTSPQTAAAPKFEAEVALAKLALEAHGGDKLRSMKTLIMRGSVDVTTSAFNQAIPATFSVILAKEKYRFEIMNPFQPVKQVFDGVNTSTTIQGGMTLPPITRLGFPLLPMVGQPGFVITSLPEGKKKTKGFRMTSPDGYYTDFYLNEKTNQIKGYDSSYDINGRIVTTSVEVDTIRVVDGIAVPEKYSQRFDTEQVTIYAAFKSKEILVNTAVDDDVFSTSK